MNNLRGGAHFVWPWYFLLDRANEIVTTTNIAQLNAILVLRETIFNFKGYYMPWLNSGLIHHTNPSLFFPSKFPESLWPDCFTWDSDNSDDHHAGTAAGRGHPRPPPRRLGPLQHRQGVVRKVSEPAVFFKAESVLIFLFSVNEWTYDLNTTRSALWMMGCLI